VSASSYYEENDGSIDQSSIRLTMGVFTLHNKLTKGIEMKREVNERNFVLRLRCTLSLESGSIQGPWHLKLCCCQVK
jgi:hypothetical protein